jgi:hypothetical protein
LAKADVDFIWFLLTIQGEPALIHPQNNGVRYAMLGKAVRKRAKQEVPKTLSASLTSNPAFSKTEHLGRSVSQGWFLYI